VANSTIATSIADVRRDINFVRLRTVTADGCGGSGSTFEDLNGHHFGRLLTTVRALTICFLGLGLIKILALLLGQCCRLVRGTSDEENGKATRQRRSLCCGLFNCGGPCGGSASVINGIQAAVGWAAWAIMLYVVIEVADSAPVGHRNVQHVWGWSFWLYFTALLCSSIAGGALCCV
jgi:hypothetical protein